MPKIRIKQSPTPNAGMFPDNLHSAVNPFEVNSTLQPVPRDQANIEAEKGETALGDFDHDGNLEHMQIGGDRHVDGGTPLNVPADTFIFSDTKSMRLKGDLVKFFGKNPDNKQGYTPADIAKQYDLNKYKAILDDPKSDPIEKRTAELMINNYKEKLGQLALMQEAHKGFPSGVPAIAQEFAQSMMPHNPMQDAPPPPGYTPGQQPQFADGGNFNGVDPYHGSTDKTPTGKSNAYDPNGSHLQDWEKIIPGISNLTNTEAQGKMYDYMLQHNPDAVKQMWSNYGLTNAGKQYGFLNGLTDSGKFKPNVLDNMGNLQQLKSAYTDGMFGARQFDPSQAKQTNTPDNSVQANPFPINNVIQQTSGNKPSGSSVPYTNQPGAAPDFTTEQGNYGMMTPDKWSIEDAAQRRANLKKYLPYIATPDITSANPTFYDPTREINSAEESENTQLMADNQFASPQAARAAASSIAGQSAARVADTIGKYDNMNVGAANQFSEQEAQNMNNYAVEKAKNDIDLYNGTVIANQQYDNSREIANDNMLKAMTNGWNNRAELELTNKTNKMYSIDPVTGHMVFTPTGRDIFNGGVQQQAGFNSDAYSKLFNQINTLNPSLSADEKHKWVMAQLDGNRETQTFNGQNPYAVKTQIRSFTGQ